MEPKKEDLMSDEMEQSQEEEADIENEHKIWKKNAPYLYDVLITWGLDWPSLCVNWTSKIDYQKDCPIYIQKMILGTFSSGQEDDFLMIVNAHLPISKIVQEFQPPEESLKKEIDNFNKMTNEQMIEEFSKNEKKIEIEAKFHHDGEVNKAKSNPFNWNIIATQTNNGEINLFKYQESEKQEIQNSTKKLKFHSKIGYALSWSLFKSNYLLSGSYDGTVCLWDIESNNSEPICHFHEHQSECEDVCFSRKKENIFGTCGDDKTIKIMDYRTDKPIISVIGHEAEINSIDFNPLNEYLYITGSNDKTVALWDLRKPELKLHSFIHHKGSILNVKWNNRRSNIFGSSGEDNKVLIWDLTQIGANIARVDNEEAPSEMIFEHGGHLDKINDFDWNPNEDMMCTFVDSSNNLQIWEMNVKSIINH